MPSINVSESDFEAVAGAAMDAKAAGRMDDARKLDVIARKINAALTAQTARNAAGWLATRQPVRWRDMPSTLGEDT